MKFLQNLFFLSLVLGLMAATSDPNAPNRAVAEQQVECGGIIWTNNEYLGSWGDSYMVTKIVDNRIYITNKGKYEENLAILLHLENNRFPNNTTSDNLIKHCVNPPDPTVAGFNYLGAQNGDQIPCNGKILKKNEWITYYLGGDGAKSYSVVKIYDGLLRIQVVRKEQPNTTIQPADLIQDPGPANCNASLVENSFLQGNKNPNWNYTSLTHNEIEGCIYKSTPVYPDRLINNACTSQPVIGTISSVSTNGLTFSFTGTGLPNLTWRIKPLVGNTANERSGKTGAVNNAGVALSFAALPSGDYRLEIEGGDCESSVNTKTFSIVAGNCGNRPVISTITNITSFGITVNFTGTNSPNTLKWRVKNAGGTVVRTGKTGSLSGTSATLSFPFLANATYKLEIEGGDCASTLSSLNFTLNATDTRSACTVAPDVRSVYDITQTSLFFNYFGENIYSLDWRIMDGSGATVANSTQTIVPVNDRPSISYNLPDGSYKLEIQGGPTCKSTPTAMAFAIGNPLPVHISKFTGEAKKEGIALSWTVVSEENGSGFQVLRYDDNVKTAKILTSIPLRERPLGNYNFLDENPSDGVNYYQLKQIDLDGSFITSKIIAVKYEGIYDMVLAPNPAKEFADLVFESRSNGVANFETYNISGIKVLNSSQKVKTGSNKLHLNISSLSEGNYILKIQNGDQTSSLRFVKIR